MKTHGVINAQVISKIHLITELVGLSPAFCKIVPFQKKEKTIGKIYLFFFACRLRISFKWMVRAFSGYLATDQLLLLWDRILGYNSLEILAGKSKYLFVKHMLFL